MIWIDMNSQTENDIRTITDLVDIEIKSVLELGCGTGWIQSNLQTRYKRLLSGSQPYD